jgi:hypothetical protein
MTGIVREIARIAKIEKSQPPMNTADTGSEKAKTGAEPLWSAFPALAR